MMNTINIVLVFVFFMACYFAIRLRNFLKDMRQDIINFKSDIGKINNLIEVKSSETQNAVYLSQLGLVFPAFMGGWSIDTFLGKLIVQHLVEYRPKTILELGSGSSTLLITRTLQLLGINEVNHIVVDHEQKYLDLTRSYACINKVDSQVKWLCCPLVNYEEMDKIWYGNLLENLNGVEIDFILIDGPPGILQNNSRYPALPLLYPFLSKRVTIMLDDANRKDEQQIVNDWISLFPEFQCTFVTEGHGVAILDRKFI